MKVALLLSGLPRKVQEGYDQCWKSIIEKYDTDIYLHYWEDEEHELVNSVYPNTVVSIKEQPFKFTEYRNGIISPADDKSRPLVDYDVYGNFRSLPMFYSWQHIFNEFKSKNHVYDCVIRSRYDLTTNGFEYQLEKLDLSKINVSNHHWLGSINLDDNLSIMNYTNFLKLFENIFDEFISYSKSIGTISFAEDNFTKIVQRRGLYKDIVKSNILPFRLLRNNKIWY